MAKNTGRRIAHFAAGGDAINATAQGLPAPTPGGGYTPGPETNPAGSWGASAESGGISGDTNVSPVGTPDLSQFNQPGDYVAPQAALPAAAANVAAAPVAAPYTGPGAATIQGSMPGGYGTPGEVSGLGGPNWLEEGGSVQSMKRGGKVRQPKPNGKPGSSQPTTDPNAQPQGRPATPLRAPLPNTDTTPYSNPMGGDTPQPAGQGFSAQPLAPSGQAIPAGPPVFDGGGAAPEQQQQDPMASVKSALSAARTQFGLSDGIFDNMKMAGGATPQTPSQQNPTQQGGGGFPDPDVNEQTKGTLGRLKKLPGLENEINSGPPNQGATPQTPTPQTPTPQAAGGGAIPEAWSTKVPLMGDRAKRKKK